MIKIHKNNSLFKIASIAYLFTACISCSFFNNEKKSDLMSNDKDKTKTNQEKETIDDYTDTYKIIPNYKLPIFKELVMKFNTQEHRFEINTCEFKYNGKSFFIGDSVDSITAIFGEPQGEITKSGDETSFYYDYNNLNISMRFSTSKKNLEVFNINLRDYDDKHISPFDILLFHKVPYYYKMKLNTFLALSDLDHTKLRHSRFSFVVRPKECAPNKDSRISHYILSRPVYATNGGGHLTYSGEFNPKESNVINGFEFIAQTLKEIKK